MTVPKTLLHPVPHALTWAFGEPIPRTSPQRYHRGADYGSPVGSDCRASEDGTVRYVRSGSFQGDLAEGGYGNHLIIAHNGGDWATLYAHMTTIKVKVGDRVQRGQIVSRTGATGKVSGPHLHFEVIDDWDYIYAGTVKDPELYYGEAEDMTPAESKLLQQAAADAKAALAEVKELQDTYNQRHIDIWALLQEIKAAVK